MRRPKILAKLGLIALIISVAVWILAIGGATAARLDILAKIDGFRGIFYAAPLAAFGVLFALIVLIAGWVMLRTTIRRALAGFLLSTGFLVLVAFVVLPTRDLPPLHDITTDTANPPQFTTLALRKDNLVGVGTVANWRRLHDEAYGDIRSVTLPMPVADAITRAETLARERGWTIAAVDPAGGRLEATAYASYLRFEDDVVLRVTPAPGGGSVVDMRSVSRVGVSDLGKNAERIRTFLSDLAAT
ncbi:DUF1499 domain-containing protein [Altererythrobacter sp. SALINAS58]|uniref:DUF1499 domain-containing protein n=1 Tax=Alteripontixanthobacter muriae TaxID=2705546 RepID=UPI0015763ECC|nr:DUF1499 domain-containing protein [Alteripontixanthobacter muriae]NTZ42501.1 DUF1499 domain-containing protein [Alteripontixanthobacter muriae]